jgi:hypothetical protein
MNKELEFVKKELRNDINTKLDMIRDKISDNNLETSFGNIEVLSFVNDELSDVLLNFEPRVLESALNDFDNDDD